MANAKVAKTKENKDAPDVAEVSEPKDAPVDVTVHGAEDVAVETPTEPEGPAPKGGEAAGVVEEVPAPDGDSKYETPNTPGERATRAYAELEERMKREALEKAPDYQKPIR